VKRAFRLPIQPDVSALDPSSRRVWFSAISDRLGGRRSSESANRAEVGDNPVYREDVSKISGMTVSERLYERDLFAAWDDATQGKDRRAMIALLGQVELEDQAEVIADEVLQRST
jgi:hypothetical protein